MDMRPNAGSAVGPLRTSASTLPFRATTAQACAWLAQRTGDAWSLARLIGHGLRPSVWLDYDANAATHFGDADGGYALPLQFLGDTGRLAGSADDVQIIVTQGSSQIVTTVRFLKRDLERLAARLTVPDTGACNR